MKRVDKSKIVKSSRGIVDCVTYTVRSFVNDGKMKCGNSVHWFPNDWGRVEKEFLLKIFCVLFFLRVARLNLDIAYWFLTVMCETKTKKAKKKNKEKTNYQNRRNKQSSTLIINSRRKGKKAEKPTFGILLLCRAKKQPSPIDSNCQIYLNCWQAFDECNLE